MGIWLANENAQSAILVADDCSAKVRGFLSEILQGHAHRVRVIAIDNSSHQLTMDESNARLSAVDALKNAEGILAANFSHVPEDRRHRYAQDAKGFIRLAADMCEHDAAVAVGDLSKLLGRVGDYTQRRLGEHLPIISVLSLFHKVGFRDDAAADLDCLCAVTGCGKHQFNEAVNAVKNSPGFVVLAGRYWYVTPEIVAQVLFNEGWQRWVAPNLKGFFESVSDEMRLQLLERVATHAREEVKETVRTFFRGWFSQLNASALHVPHITSLACALVETAPDEYSFKLQRSMENAQLRRNLQESRGDGYGLK